MSTLDTAEADGWAEPSPPRDPASPRELKGLIRDWRRGRATKNLTEVFHDAYVALIGALMIGAMLVNVVLKAQRTIAQCDSVSCLSARTVLPWAGFAAAIRAGVDMVMVSSATYPRLDPDERAAFSAPVMQILRRDLAFPGVIISDDLAARALEDVRPRARALRFLRAGGDLAIVGDARLVPAMASAVSDEADDDPEFAAQVKEKAERVVAMKARRGLVNC